MYSIKEKCEQPKHQVDTHVQLHKKKTVTSLKFKTVFAPEKCEGGDFHSLIIFDVYID